MNPTLHIGVNIDGVLHRDDLPRVDAETQFRMIADAGVFDYVEMNPPAGVALARYVELSERYALPVRVIGGIFCAGRDEAHLRHVIEWAPRFGSKVLNCQLYANHADGHRLTDAEVASFYVDACEWAVPVGCLPSLEVHVDMWNEDFGRVSRVGELLARDGIALHLTLDHSHLIFKIGNDEELDASKIRALVEAGEIVLDPDSPDAIFKQWIARGWVHHAHARSVIPNNPRNSSMRRPDGRPGRGIQYPFVRPAADQWDGSWDEAALLPWKNAVRHLLNARAQGGFFTPRHISCEFIPFADYGGGTGYSIFENNVACAAWLRNTWLEQTAGQTAITA
ncbi:xylose isomerase [Paraburkholderia madseniana]|uniref:Xylose isomerase n=1 Tax=Paraburkholderia madseniana TaxID=2599607 RepID=A0A6N6WJV7_9BURK|nr:xylose isomerase [Paraburkholderia madseniana]KAE8760114.1 xylose isomerase [Paraburkholderia madseniana]